MVSRVAIVSARSGSPVLGRPLLLAGSGRSSIKQAIASASCSARVESRTETGIALMCFSSMTKLVSWFRLILSPVAVRVSLVRCHCPARSR